MVKRCLKFTGYIYLPKEKDNKINALRYFASRTPGRIIIYDEDNKRPKEKAKGFDNLGQMVSFIEKRRRSLVYKRIKRKK